MAVNGGGHHITLNKRGKRWDAENFGFIKMRIVEIMHPSNCNHGRFKIIGGRFFSLPTQIVDMATKSREAFKKCKNNTENKHMIWEIIVSRVMWSEVKWGICAFPSYLIGSLWCNKRLPSKQKLDNLIS